jgi:hypothetical protein
MMQIIEMMATTSMAENHHSDRKQPRRTVRALAGPAALFLICCALFWKLVLTNQYTWLEGPDLANQVLPWLQFQAGEWHAGRFPLWDPYHWGGQPLAGQAQPGVVYPFNWILLSLPLKEGWLRQSYLHWYFVLIHYMGALFAYLLCRDLKLNRIAAVLGGTAFACTGFVGSVDWPQMLNGAIWAPLVILFLLRAGRGEKPVASAALSGAFLGMAWLSGHHQAPIFLSLAVAAAWLFLILRAGGIRRDVLALAALSAVFAIFCGAFQLLPAYEYGKLAHRWVGGEGPVTWKDPVPYSVHAEYSLKLQSLFGILFPGYHVHTATFSGVVVFSLGVLAAAALWRDPRVRFFAALGLGGLLISLGSNSVFHGVLYAAVPMVEKARSPGVAAYLFNFSVAILSAFSVQELLSGSYSGHIRKYGKSLFIFSIVTLLFGFIVTEMRQFGLTQDRLILSGLAGLLLAAAIAAYNAGHLSPRATAICCLGLAVFEFGGFVGYALPHRGEKNRTIYLNRMAENADIVKFLRSQPGPFRVDVDDKEIPFNFGDWHGIETLGGYLASVSSNLLNAEIHTDRGQNLMNVRYAVRRQPNRAGQREIFSGQSGLKVFENPGALPRARTVHEVEQAQTGQIAASKLSQETFDVAAKALVSGEVPDLERCAGEDEVIVVSRTSNSVSLLAEMGCNGMVVLADTYFPGWTATVDGRRVPVYETYGMIRGVVVEAGPHTIEMRYRPWTAIAGGLMTAIGFLSAFVIWRVSLRPPRTDSRPGLTTGCE